jgi:hypothetical protein
MHMFRPRRPSAALVVSVIALIVALGGTAYAGVKLGKNSVGTKQLKNGAVTSSKIKNGSVTAGKLSLTGVTVPSARHADKADAATSATSATNAINATNASHASSADKAADADTATALGTVFYARSDTIDSAGCGSSPCGGAFSDTSGKETRPAGTVVIAGGVTTSGPGLELNEGEPLQSNTGGPLDTWFVFVDNFTNTPRTFTVWAICVKAQSQDTGPMSMSATGSAVG